MVGVARGPQISQWTKSNEQRDLLILMEKCCCFCLARGQVWQVIGLDKESKGK